MKRGFITGSHDGAALIHDFEIALPATLPKTSRPASAKANRHGREREST